MKTRLSPEVIEKTTKFLETLIVDTSRVLAKTTGKSGIIKCQFHGVPYLGAAHGTIGVLYMLMKSMEAVPSLKEELSELVEASVAHFTDLMWSNGGNIPVAENIDKNLHHWCHGAPGIIPMLSTAFGLVS